MPRLGGGWMRCCASDAAQLNAANDRYKKNYIDDYALRGKRRIVHVALGMLLLWSSNAVFVAAVACKLVRTYAQAPLASGARMVSPWMTEKRGQRSLFIDEKVKKNVETGNESMPTCCLVATCGACCCSALLLRPLELKLPAQIANIFL